MHLLIQGEKVILSGLTLVKKKKEPHYIVEFLAMPYLRLISRKAKAALKRTRIEFIYNGVLLVGPAIIYLLLGFLEDAAAS